MECVHGFVHKHQHYANASNRMAVTKSSRAMICVVHVGQSAPLNSLYTNTPSRADTSSVPRLSA